ncbi:hypothetical protein ACQ3G6_09565 [Allorhizobium undicola]|uniref:hypothetical protein n=1 Tax=Allorhizobium undicola TaxID=78527 RepID=UPI003D33D371
MTEQTSPAVESLEQENARRGHESPDKNLQRGLEETFPASDPVSVTRTDTPTGRVDADDVENQHRMNKAASNPTPEDDVPHVISALNQRQRNGDDPETEIRYLRTEIARLEGSRPVAAGRTNVTGDLSGLIRSRPLQAVAAAGLIGFVWGLTR